MKNYTKVILIGLVTLLIIGCAPMTRKEARDYNRILVEGLESQRDINRREIQRSENRMKCTTTRYYNTYNTKCRNY